MAWLLLVGPLVAAALAAIAAGGSMRNVSRVRLSWPGLAVAAIASGFVGLLLPQWRVVALVCAQVFLIAFLLAARDPGLSLAALGVGANALVIALNGAMPVSAWAADEVGRALEPGVKHAALAAGTSLGFLGDVVPVAPLASVVSLGDILIVLGLALFTYKAVRGVSV